MKSKVKKVSCRMLSVLLSFLMVFYLIPTTIFADLFYSDDWESVTVNDAVAEKNMEIIELDNLREENVKHFRLEDGSIMAVQYPNAVHRKNEVGKWTDIDNHLSENGNDFASSEARVKFVKKTTGNGTLFTLSEKNKKIEISLVNANKKVVGKVTNTNTEFDEKTTQLQKKMTLDHLSARILYADILDGVDLEYVIVSNDIKENIIVKERKDFYAYTFNVKLNNLSAALTEAGEIVFFDSDNNVCYVTPAGIMEDAAGNTSNAVSYCLQDLGNGSYSFTVTPDASWINQEGRAFPVTVDPPIYANYQSNVTDLYVSSDSSGSSYNTSTGLRLGNNTHIYWKVSLLPEIPSSAYITNATFSMSEVLQDSSTRSGYIGIYAVNSAWSSTFTWNQAQAAGSLSVATNFSDLQMFENVEMEESSKEPVINTYAWNVTAIVKGWYNGNANNGLMLKPIGNFSGSVSLCSNEYSAIDQRPHLCIQYVDMKGVEDYWSYSSHSLGFAGAGAVNHATGNLVFSIPTLTTTDAILPITPTLVYNTALSNGGYTTSNAAVPYTQTFLPNGFKLNLQESLLKMPYVDQNGNQKSMYVWTDGDGTEHYFLPTSTANVYKDEDSLQLTLTAGYASCTIENRDGTKRVFSAYDTTPNGYEEAWYLELIEDTAGNQLIIDVNANYKPMSLLLLPNDWSGSLIMQMHFLYNTSGMLAAVVNLTAQEATLLYYSNGKLSQVVRAHGSASVTLDNWETVADSADASVTGITKDATAVYTYSGNHLLGVENQLSDYKISYLYSGDKVIKISEAASNGSEETAGQSIQLTYSTQSTKVRTSGSDDVFGTEDDLITTYCLDQSGRTINCYTTDLQATKLYGASGGRYEDSNSQAKNNLKSSVQTEQTSANYLLNGGFEDRTSALRYWEVSGTAVAENGEFTQETSGVRIRLQANADDFTELSQEVHLEAGEYTFGILYDPTFATDAALTLYVSGTGVTAHGESVVRLTEQKAAVGNLYTSISFSVASATDVWVTIALDCYSTAGSITVDDAMLSQGLSAAPYNMVQMGDMNEVDYAASINTVWLNANGSSATANIQSFGDDRFGYVYAIDDVVGVDQTVMQTIYQAPAYMAEESTPYTPSINLTVSGWARGTAQSYGAGSFFEIQLIVEYACAGAPAGGDVLRLPFHRDINSWQFVSGNFSTTAGGHYINSIKVALVYEGHPGSVYFDNVSVIKEDSNTCDYRYNEQGLMEYSRTGSAKTWYAYDGNGRLVQTVDNYRNIVKYTYQGDTTLVTREEHKNYYNTFYNEETNKINDETKIVDAYSYEYSYDDYGLLKETLIQPAVESQEEPENIIAYEYNISADTAHIFGTLACTTDPMGRSTRNFYNAANGRLIATVAPDGNGTYYTYNVVGDLVMVTPAKYNATSNSASSVANSAEVNYTYDTATRRLNVIQTESTAYYFTYDCFGNTTSVTVGSGSGASTLASYTYLANNGKLDTLTYGNGLQEKYYYDNLDRVSETWYNTGEGGALELRYSYVYNANGALHTVTDHKNDTQTLYRYDGAGKLIASYELNSDEIVYSDSFVYTDDEKLAQYNSWLSYKTNTGYYREYAFDAYGYNSNRQISTYRIVSDNLDSDIAFTYDNMLRVSGETLTWGDQYGAIYQQQTVYDYHGETPQLNGITVNLYGGEGETQISSKTYRYTYDQNGNITEIKDANNVIQNKYYYDDLGQLIREDNRALNKTYTYEYDDAGNMLYKRQCAFTTSATLPAMSTIFDMSYKTYGGWGDQMDMDNINYYGYTYDKVGNLVEVYYPEEYFLFTWEGRQLTSAKWYYDDYSYSTPIRFNYYDVQYTYNESGIRTSKTVDGVKHEYLLNGSQIVAETWTKNGIEYMLRYVYDESGSPIGMKYRTSQQDAEYYTLYFFEKNAFGDIIGVYDSNSGLLGTYTYDAWGNCTVSGTDSILNMNPFRYRGYYYDTETGFYYLQSRYYNPAWGRFLSSDAIGYLGVGDAFYSYNLYAYCGNNPVMGYDPEGTWDWGTFWGGVDLLSIGIGAIAISASILTCGAAAPAMVAIAAVTMAAGVATTVNGVAEVVEAGTDYNFVQETVFQGDEAAYETYRNITKTTAEIGTAICGTYYTVKGGNVCFIAGTLIATSVGHIGIENIQAGDWVWATNPETGETDLKQVVQTFVNETDKLVHLTIGEETITTTPTHPFYVPQKGWIDACKLRAGDILVMLNGEYVVIEKVQHELLEAPIVVYNFEVEDFHTYHVGDLEVLVHNKCGPQFDDNQKALLELANENRRGVTRSDADLLVQWANEYGISNHGPMNHPTRNGIWSIIEHIKIKNLHIPINGG